MTPEQFIISRLEALRATPQPAPADLEEKIYSALMSKKFRKYGSTDKQKEGIRNAIHLAVSENKPIQFILMFGAYKLWRLEETPEADWAELFTMMYFAKWLKPVTDMYKPGVEFVFSSDDVVIPQMNNISEDDTAAYAKSFKKVIQFLKGYAPENMTFSFERIGDLYDTREEFDADLAERMKEYAATFESGYPSLSEDDIRAIELNVRLTPEQAKDPLWREKVDIMHMGFYAVKKRRPFNRAVEKIAVFPTLLPNYNCIAVGTTKTSITKFWVGVGALQKRDDSFIESILSPSQLDVAKFDWVPVSLPGLTGKNFNKIRVM